MRMKFGFVAVLAGLTLAGANVAHAQRKPLESRASASRGAAGSDQNIKSDADKTNKKNAAPIPLPPKKGGAKTRGAAVGELHVDNRTSWYIRIYVDGDYRGTIAPMGDWYANGDCDEFTLYGEARFDDGSRYTFGPVRTSADCSSQVWTLRPSR